VPRCKAFVVDSCIHRFLATPSSPSPLCWVSHAGDRSTRFAKASIVHEQHFAVKISIVLKKISLRACKPNSPTLAVLLSIQLMTGPLAEQSRLESQFSGGFSGGDGGELNSPSKRTHRRMYYRFSRCFGFALRTPIDRIRQRWPSGL